MTQGRGFENQNKSKLAKLRAKMQREMRARELERQQARRKDARQKIELGGLIVKAGMRNHNKAALYAGLMELAEKLADPDELRRLRGIGEMLFRS